MHAVRMRHVVRPTTVGRAKDSPWVSNVCQQTESELTMEGFCRRRTDGTRGTHFIITVRPAPSLLSYTGKDRRAAAREKLVFLPADGHEFRSLLCS